MNSALFRTLLVYGIVLPLAVVIGWMMSSPDDVKSLTVIGAVVFVLLLPVILKYHYGLLVFSWNASIIVFFLPAQPTFWALMVTINVFMAVCYRILQRRPLFTHVPMLTFSLLGLALVVLITAKLRGGIGMRSLGSGSYGGKQYFYLLMSILGYFAFASQSIDMAKIGRFTKSFYLSGLTGVISNLIYSLPSLWFLYLIFPAGLALSQAQAEYFGLRMSRIAGFSLVGTSVLYYLLARHGLAGVLSVRKPWRILIFGVVLLLCAASGYRSILLLVILLISALYCLEGWFFTRWSFVALLAGGLVFAAAIPFANKLPLGIQRSLSVLPINVDPVARMDAQGTTEWRLLLWKAMLPELPKYIWLGKGYAIDPTAMYLTQQAYRYGFAPDYANSIVVGDYHSGPLSVYVSFGLPGVIAFLAFWAACVRALWLNYKYGRDETRVLNRFLLAMFIAKALLFVGIFGSLHSDLATFTGLIGVSVALNRGVCRRPATKSSVAATARPLGLQPSAA
ncbi:MAG TPA: O-antigen ligase family protein [Candidatus Acidoferrum sp.]|nr:O-antigen ligase family protein [Candidatus Acidoferrum sp.]